MGPLCQMGKKGRLVRSSHLKTKIAEKKACLGTCWTSSRKKSETPTQIVWCSCGNFPLRPSQEGEENRPKESCLRLCEESIRIASWNTKLWVGVVVSAGVGSPCGGAGQKAPPRPSRSLQRKRSRFHQSRPGCMSTRTSLQGRAANPKHKQTTCLLHLPSIASRGIVQCRGCLRQDTGYGGMRSKITAEQAATWRQGRFLVKSGTSSYRA